MNEDEKDLVLAQRIRKAMEMIGYPPVPRCLPTEPEHGRCGLDAISHAKAYYAIMAGTIRHVLSHASAEEAEWLNKLSAAAESDAAARCCLLG